MIDEYGLVNDTRMMSAEERIISAVAYGMPQEEIDEITRSVDDQTAIMLSGALLSICQRAAEIEEYISTLRITRKASDESKAHELATKRKRAIRKVLGYTYP